MPIPGRSLLLIGLLVWIHPVFAVRMVPIVAEAISSGEPVEQNFRIDNPSGSPAAVEISILKRRTTLDGEEVREPAGDQFVVFPEQMVLMPGESQLIRIQWLGKAGLTSELAYRVIAEELPVDFTREQEAGEQATGEQEKVTGTGPTIHLLMRYEGMLYIQPPRSRAHVEVASSRIVDHEGEKHLELVLVNSGNMHIVIDEPRVSIGQKDGTVDLPETEVRQKLNVNMLASEKRRFLLRWPNGLDPDVLDVQFHYKSTH
jgi:fimbrial chaperone protein